jgi:hypothetical protein
MPALIKIKKKTKCDYCKRPLLPGSYSYGIELYEMGAKPIFCTLTHLEYSEWWTEFKRVKKRQKHG